jgi:hypothetical protein
VIAMVSYPQAAFDQLGNPLGRPELRLVAMRHGPLGQEPHEPFFLSRGQPRWPTGRGLGLQRLGPACLQRITPPQDTAGVAADAPGNLVQRQPLLEEDDHSAPTRFE